MRMMGRNFVRGVCSCRDCDGPIVKGRAAEKRETEQWRDEYEPRILGQVTCCDDPWVKDCDC